MAAAAVRTTPTGSAPAQNVASELPHVSRASATTEKSPRVLIDVAPWYHAGIVGGAQGSEPTHVRNAASIRSLEVRVGRPSEVLLTGGRVSEEASGSKRLKRGGPGVHRVGVPRVAYL